MKDLTDLGWRDAGARITRDRPYRGLQIVGATDFEIVIEGKIDRLGDDLAEGWH
ncbi:hypothetical protein [Bradyrhizobium genomosp. I (2014)]|uniref:hypothetical protein n=1 Tax=Bradyrhizobium genomosp. I (2014) TaxID=2683269 RepID=UPI0012F9BBC6|nr:hypothetical protein [Bradyrhizobium sp. CCBAU 43298]